MLALRCAALLAATWLVISTPAAADETSSEARRLYTEGKAHYAQGHYEQAAQLFQRSYALSESPALLFNMAQAHRLAGPEHCSKALILYKSYLSALPEAENRKEVEERITELGECSPRPAPSEPAPPAALPLREAKPDRQEEAPPPAPTVRRPASSGLPTGPVLTTGAGAALLVAGGVLYYRAWDKHREAERVCPCYPGTYSEWEVLTNVSYALLAVGGATVAGGVTWWVVGEPAHASQPSRAMLGIAGTF